MKTIITNVPERADFVAGNKTVEIGYPWLTPGAIMALELILTKDFTVFECGVGGSTVFYAQRVKSVISVDTNELWAKKVETRVAEFGNTKIFLLGGTEKFLEFIASQTECYDLVSVDSDPNTTNRLVLVNALVQKVKINGWLLLDNYNEWVRMFSYPGKWRIYTYDDFNWAGQGTRLCQRVE